MTLSGIDSSQQGFALIAPMMGAFAEMARTGANYRTRRGLQAKALRGSSAGGCAYGYDSIAQPDGRKRLVVNDEQAAVVRRILEMCADGVSPRAIAETLNAERIPSPGAAWARTDSARRRDAKWVASAVHGEPDRGTGLLNNAKYIGRTVWGRTPWTRSAQDSGVRRVERQPDGGYAARLETTPAALIALVSGSGGRDDMSGSGGAISDFRTTPVPFRFELRGG